MRQGCKSLCTGFVPGFHTAIDADALPLCFVLPACVPAVETSYF